MPRVTCMFNFLNHNNHQPSNFVLTPTSSPTYLFIEILAIDISERALAHKLSIGVHFGTPVRRRHDRIVWAVVCKSVNTELSGYMTCLEWVCIPSRSLRNARFMPVIVSAINAACAAMVSVQLSGKRRVGGVNGIGGRGSVPGGEAILWI